MVHAKHILVVEREGGVRQVVSDLLVNLGHRVSSVSDAAGMRAFLESVVVDLIVLDASTSEAEEVTLAVRARDRGVRLVMISGHPAIMERFHERADQLLHKPFAGAELERALRYALGSDIRGQRGEDPD